MVTEEIPNKKEWSLSLGANWVGEGKVEFKVWAPSCRDIEVEIINNKTKLKLNKDQEGYFTGQLENIKLGTLYKYKINDGQSYPDPVSRFLPEGPHGPTQIVDPNHYVWHDQNWKGISMQGQIIYEMHVGAFTKEGTFDAAATQLEELARIGITLIELMPCLEFPGRWNAGYDISNLFAPSHIYGDYEALKRFVDKAHQLGLGVILDLVYNHFGPVGCYNAMFSEFYFSTKYKTDWGEAINFDGVGSSEVRKFFLSNICYWLSEFHLDGFRMDSTHDIYDDSIPHIFAELTQRGREVAFPKKIVFIAENLPHDIKFLHAQKDNGYEFDAIWNDDFHNLTVVALLGRSEAFYLDYKGDSQNYVSLLKKSFLYQGQSCWTGKPRGTPVENEPACAFVGYLQNHDLVSNQLRGERLHQLIEPALFRAVTALFLLAPQTPLIFMGQEFCSSKPFSFFADHDDSMGKITSAGRKKFLEMFPSYVEVFQSSDAHKFIPDVASPQTFEQSQLDLTERESHKEMYLLHQDLFKIRKEDPVISKQDRSKLDGAVLNDACFILRYFGEKGDDRLILVNFGKDIFAKSIAEPLIAPSKKGEWKLIWSSENLNYGGKGISNPIQNGDWHIIGHCLLLLKSISESDKPLLERNLKEQKS